MSWLLLLTISALVNFSLASASAPTFRISVGKPGVYRVPYEALVAAGLPSEPVKSSALGLLQRDETVPIWVADGGDGILGPGDWFEFVGKRLAGENRYFHEYSNWNVYWLHLDRNFSHRMKVQAAVSKEEIETAGASGLPLRALQHLEEDRLLIRLSGYEVKGLEQPEVWYWAKLTQIDSDPFGVPLNLGDLDTTSPQKVFLKLYFRALSHPQGLANNGLTDHHVDLSLNGKPIASANWNGRTTYLLELPPLEVAAFTAGENKLTLSVPARTAPNGSDPVVDVAMLDWIEVDYPRSEVVIEGQARLNLGEGAATGIVRLTAPGASGLVAYGNKGSRIEAPELPPSGAEGQSTAKHLVFRPAEAEDSYFVVLDQKVRFPEQIQQDQPSDLKSKTLHADYLMIAHQQLLEAATPLAEFHRGRGLRVALVDVQDIYDEFNHGIVHPRAIRDFIDHAYRRWLKPAPRFVLLVGDASWDTKNKTVDDANYANWTTHQLLNGPRFVLKQSVVYRNAPEENRRNLIPTWNYHSSHGHSASDNWFVSLEEKDFHPVLAIGRFPVTEPEEVRGIIEKTIRYVEDPPVGPWRRNSLWITNEQKGFHQASDQLATMASERGLGVLKVYPLPEDAGNAAHQTRLREAFDQGQFLVHFYGHGGRYIWRTGPPDLKKNHDLFTLDDLEQLQPTGRLSVVLSMTCFSAPLDHPNADSIGEKFLRLPERGAVGVLAASWRNSPSFQYSQKLVDELTQPGTIGEAILRAKQQIQNPNLVESYNLLGDPAVPLAVPQLRVALTPAWSAQPSLSVKAEVAASEFRGRAVVDWLDESGAALDSQEQAVEEPRFEATYQGAQEKLSEVRSVRLYVWDETSSVDGIGRKDVPPLASTSASQQSGLGQ